MTDTDPTNHVEIDWATAEVSDRCLKVGLTGPESKDWSTRLEAVLTRLEQPGHLWGRIRPTKGHLTVADVPPGHEAELRHLLDAAVMQTNADVATRASPQAGEQVSEVDQRMADAFRAAPGSSGGS